MPEADRCESTDWVVALSYVLWPETRLSQKKIIDFFRIRNCNCKKDKCSSPLEMKKRRRRSGSLVYQKKRRRLLPFISSQDHSERLKQMGTLASALTALQMEFSNDLTYMPGMASTSANQSKFEDGGMQVLSKEDIETLEQCRAMCRRGECPPLMVVFDACEGFTVVADGLIKDMTLIAEYTGDVDYIRNREHDDCDSMMTLLLAEDPSRSLVICPDKRGNIARFINGINNHTPDGKKKQNCKCVRYSVNGECRVVLVATRDIAKGERLYYDYNGYEHEYPTQHFV
uniref:[histone H3]-lysine(27) N-methyltransferase n=1 Tax=Manihot esculenta TaxID=3983 RepID=A0A2C9UQ71_MANES